MSKEVKNLFKLIGTATFSFFIILSYQNCSKDLGDMGSDTVTKKQTDPENNNQAPKILVSDSFGNTNPMSLNMNADILISYTNFLGASAQLYSCSDTKMDGAYPSLPCYHPSIAAEENIYNRQDVQVLNNTTAVLTTKSVKKVNQSTYSYYQHFGIEFKISARSGSDWVSSSFYVNPPHRSEATNEVVQWYTSDANGMNRIWDVYTNALAVDVNEAFYAHIFIPNGKEAKFCVLSYSHNNNYAATQAPSIESSSDPCWTDFPVAAYSLVETTNSGKWYRASYSNGLQGILAPGNALVSYWRYKSNDARAYEGETRLLVK